MTLRLAKLARRLGFTPARELSLERYAGDPPSWVIIGTSGGDCWLPGTREARSESEALDACEGGQLSNSALTLMREKGIAASRQLAKRQLTWLRSMPQRHVVDADAQDPFSAALDVLGDLPSL